MMMMGMLMMIKMKLFGEDAAVYLFDFSVFEKIGERFRYSNLVFVSANLERNSRLDDGRRVYDDVADAETRKGWQSLAEQWSLERRRRRYPSLQFNHKNRINSLIRIQSNFIQERERPM